MQTGSVGTIGTDLFHGFMPDEPDALVAIFEGPGYPPEQAMTLSAGQQIMRNDGLQVFVRSARMEDSSTYYEDAKTKASSVYTLLHNMAGQTVGTTIVMDVQARSSPYLLSRDENNRALFVFNMDVKNR
jgi:hypothetical protein